MLGAGYAYEQRAKARVAPRYLPSRMWGPGWRGGGSALPSSPIIAFGVSPSPDGRAHQVNMIYIEALATEALKPRDPRVKARA